MLNCFIKQETKMLSFEMTSLQYFDNISFYISPKNKNLDISKIYTKWAAEKCPIWTPRKPRNSKYKSGYSIMGHPVNENNKEKKALKVARKIND